MYSLSSKIIKNEVNADEEVSEDAGREFQGVLCSDVSVHVICK